MDKKFNEKSRKKSLVKNLFLGLSLALVLLLTFPASSAPKKGLRLIKTEDRALGQTYREHGPIGPAQYIPIKPTYTSFQVYDLQSSRFLDVPPPEKMQGIPQPPAKRPDKLTRLRLELEGKLIRHKKKSLIYYNGTEAGYLIERSRRYKAVSGNPPCACGGQSRLIEKYQRYYCPACRKYVPVKDYIKEKNDFIYYQFGLASKRLLRTTPLPAGPLGLKTLGVDAAKNIIYFTDIAYVSKKHPVSKGRVRVLKLDTENGKVEEIVQKIPVRKRTNYKHWSLRPYHSRHFRWIAFVEYDEAGGRNNTPHLKNPGPQAYFLDIKENRIFSVPIDVTTYGVAIDENAGYAALASNQTGRVKLVNLKTQKTIKTLRGDKTVAQAILSPVGKRLYILTKRGLRHYAWPALKKGRFVPMGQIFPGVKTFLTASRLHISGDGKYAWIGRLDTQKSRWSSPHPEKGFHILAID